ncbi:hypothetical protein T440DRAFT_225536 [Plenodomus tracheiphilus IPT5]|uniref:EthD domain-containing protein n=1 Tax=Plenodomus tracheiphilus IPT5 TaxID=1408161 RepID=A0A6A7AUC9_9PLEO|nr:hypothetical protein T440DRAFT_225536 [Plenodomus tracheiphilus IPT5]
MSGVMCVWANLPEQALDWYENEYLPEQTALNSKHTLYCEVTQTGLEQEPIGHLDAPWELLAVYEVEDIKKMTQDTYDKKTHPPERVADLLKDARFDVRTYRELHRWGGEHWDGDINQIASVTAMEWRVPKTEEAEVVKFYTEVLAPMVAESQDVLRFRLFEVDNATVYDRHTYITKEKEALHSYFTMVEFESDEWPWDKVMMLSELDQWRKYFESQDIVKWQTSHYMVQRKYPDSHPGSPKTNEGDLTAGT